MSYYIGLMSGTSLDAVDAVLVNLNGPTPVLLGSHSQAIPPALRAQLSALFTTGPDEIERMGPLHRQLGYLYCEAVEALIQAVPVQRSQIITIGNHGQTIRHRPRLEADRAFSLQIGDNHFLAQSTGICVVADFRSRDIALGGQGAPLVPGFHRAVFGSSQINRSVLNLGGIANLTYLPTTGDCIGFDTGPGNGLLDAWVQQVQNRPFDADGHWAASGVVNTELLAHLLNHHYFVLPPPKSTGKEEFTSAWLQAALTERASLDGPIPPEDVQRTLVELTALNVSRDLKEFCPASEEIYVCGGGIKNRLLMDRLQAILQKPLFSTAQLGVEPQWVEAMAFAWLAKRCLEGLPGNLPSVTGASQAAVLGAIFPAG